VVARGVDLADDRAELVGPGNAGQKAEHPVSLPTCAAKRIRP
jgi:hypothetical protein